MSYSKFKCAIAIRYFLNGSSSVFQALLKSSLVPLKDFDSVLPKNGVILDLGCGEGILANLVAKLRPNCTVIGIDRDESRLNFANINAEPNSKFFYGDILSLDRKYKNVTAVILNDVVHHQDYPFHQKLLLSTLKSLKANGVLLLKEVDQKDKADLFMTSFFDKRIYPNDKLSFRTKDEWRDILSRLGVTSVTIKKLSHPWPASRTLICAHKPRSLIDPYLMAKSIGKSNLLAAKKNTIVFITGATGFLGSHLTELLNKEGLNSKPIRLIYLKRNFFSGNIVNGTPLFGDLNDLVFLKDALKGVDYIFHLAAEVKLTKGIDLWRNNYRGTISLINSLKDLKIKRLIYASTIGAIDREPNDACLKPLDERAKPHPLSEYGKTKLLSEIAIKKSKIPYSVIRVTWAYGKNMTPDTHVRFLTNGAFHKKLFSFFNLPGKVSVIAAIDVAKAFKFVAENKNTLNNTYFISDGKPISLGNLFKIYRSVIGDYQKLINIPKFMIFLINKLRKFLPLQIQALASDVLTANPNKLFSLGFVPTMKLREGLEVLAFDQGHLRRDVFQAKRRPISIITGAAHGIGKALAERMSIHGHHLLLIDKDHNELLKISNKTKSDFLALNLVSHESVSAIESYISKNNYRVDWLINNAGIGIRESFKNNHPDNLNELMHVNCISLVLLSNFFMRNTQYTKRGVLINIGSSSGFQPLPYMATYAASKSFVQSLTFSLIGESLNDKSTKILLVDPSGTNTKFQSNANVKKNYNENLLTSDFVAFSIINAVYDNKSHIIIGKIGKIMSFLPKILPKKLQLKLWLYLMTRLR
jgi:short-subunit dehydrogenase/uncharacterized protein YbjT (DUF2867 family)/predicted RNA methylase